MPENIIDGETVREICTNACIEYWDLRQMMAYTLLIERSLGRLKAYEGDPNVDSAISALKVEMKRIDKEVAKREAEYRKGS